MQNARFLVMRLTTTSAATLPRCNACWFTRPHASSVAAAQLFHSPRRLESSSAAAAAAAIPAPTLDGEEKNYAPKIRKLVEEISKLTLMEVADLNELLKKSLNIADAPMMMPVGQMMGGTMKASEPEEDAGAKVEKSLFTVRLIKFDEAKKVALIKEVKNHVAGMNLVQAKKYVESLPQTVVTDVSKEEAEKLKTALTAVGATVEVD